MSIFEDVKIYSGSWNVKSVNKMSQSDVAQISRAEVVPSEFGLSVMFLLKAGGKVYYPVSNDCNAVVGQSVNPETCEVVTLERAGDKDIRRIRF